MAGSIRSGRRETELNLSPALTTLVLPGRFNLTLTPMSHPGCGWRGRADGERSRALLLRPDGLLSRRRCWPPPGACPQASRPRSRQALAELVRTSGLIRRISVNLNQAVARLNATGQHSGDLSTYAAESLQCRS
jgi:hypothetical protein